MKYDFNAAAKETEQRNTVSSSCYYCNLDSDAVLSFPWILQQPVRLWNQRKNWIRIHKQDRCPGCF